MTISTKQFVLVFAAKPFTLNETAIHDTMSAKTFRFLLPCAAALLSSCQPDSSQSQQRIQELTSENARDKARIESLSKQVETLSASTQGMNEKLDKLISQSDQKAAAPAPSSDADVSAPLTKLVQRLQQGQAATQGVQIKGYAKSVNAVVVIRTGDSASAVNVPFAKLTEGGEWTPLLSDDQIVAAASKSGSSSGGSSSLGASFGQDPGLRVRAPDSTPRDNNRPRPIRLGDVAGGAGSDQQIDPIQSGAPKVNASPDAPSSSATPPASGDNKTGPLSDGGTHFIEKNGRKVLRLQP